MTTEMQAGARLAAIVWPEREASPEIDLFGIGSEQADFDPGWTELAPSCGYRCCRSLPPAQIANAEHATTARWAMRTQCPFDASTAAQR